MTSRPRQGERGKGKQNRTLLYEIAALLIIHVEDQKLRAAEEVSLYRKAAGFDGTLEAYNTRVSSIVIAYEKSGKKAPDGAIQSSRVFQVYEERKAQGLLLEQLQLALRAVDDHEIEITAEAHSACASSLQRMVDNTENGIPRFPNDPEWRTIVDTIWRVSHQGFLYARSAMLAALGPRDETAQSKWKKALYGSNEELIVSASGSSDLTSLHYCKEIYTSLIDATKHQERRLALLKTIKTHFVDLKKHLSHEGNHVHPYRFSRAHQVIDRQLVGAPAPEVLE